MECYATHLGLWVRVKIVDIYSSLYPLPPRFSPNLANKACPFALHACRHEAKPRACNKGKATRPCFVSQGGWILISDTSKQDSCVSNVSLTLSHSFSPSLHACSVRYLCVQLYLRNWVIERVEPFNYILRTTKNWCLKHIVVLLLFEENPLLKNCGIPLERGRN